jgi:hypothetical protein
MIMSALRRTASAVLSPSSSPEASPIVLPDADIADNLEQRSTRVVGAAGGFMIAPVVGGCKPW